MDVLIGLLTLIMLASSLLLILLVLMQLPKKEAGLGQAFGSGATDALFGAGSGNVLTKATKYCAGVFLVLALVLSVMISHRYGDNKKTRDLQLATPEAPAAAKNPAQAPLTAPAIQLPSDVTAPANGAAPKAVDAPKTAAPAAPATPEKK